MAHSPVIHDKGTRITNYSSIHSADAFIGEYQVMYTPGNTSPQQSRANRKSTRFSRTASGKPEQNLSRSYVLPSNMPNTSQIMPDHGLLPNIQVHYGVPPDEKQIVASLRILQKDLAEAMQTIADLTRERDEAMREIQILKARNPHKSSSRRQRSQAIEDELFDLSSPLHDLPDSRRPHSKKEVDQKQTHVSDDARVIEAPIQVVNFRKESDSQPRRHQSSRRVTEDTEESATGEANRTGVSNTSRRRRRASFDDNMTSAYILPDITMEKPGQVPTVSKAAQEVIHSLEPEHIDNCDVCHRLTTHIRHSERQAARKQQKPQEKPSTVQTGHPTRVQDFAAFCPSVESSSVASGPANKQPDYTAAVAGFMPEDSYVGDATLRPKLAPTSALTRVRDLMHAQFNRAKERHDVAWRRYDRVEAPLSSRKHAEIAKELRHWAEKMEECRVHLDYLRDVEEGMSSSL